MDKIKEKILIKALDLYNEKGFNKVSIRGLSKELRISHSNLLYHFPTQEDIVLGLHEMLFEKAIKLNGQILRKPFSIEMFFESTIKGFSIVYEFRFLFVDFHSICKLFPRLKAILISVAEVRASMYFGLIDEMITRNIIREKEYENEYCNLIELIKIFSDNWVSSAMVYDDSTEEKLIRRYTILLLSFFYPYMYSDAKEKFHMLVNQ